MFMPQTRQTSPSTNGRECMISFAKGDAGGSGNPCPRRPERSKRRKRHGDGPDAHPSEGG